MHHIGESRTSREAVDNEEEILLKNENSGTDDEPKINYRGWKVMPFIIGNEIFEKLGAIGTLSNLLVYLTTVFNLENITATNIINIFNGSTNFATIIGAFCSDTYFGRYKTLGFCTVASFLGLLVIQLTAAIEKLHPPHCEENTTCKGPTEGQMTFLKTGLGLLLIGAAGIRPCNLAFGADQFNPNTDSGKKGINSFFNWYFFTFTIAQMISLTIIVYIQSNVSWAVGLGIPAALMLLSSVIFFLGSNMYVKVKPSGSPLTSIVQVIVVAAKKRKLKLSEYLYPSLFNYLPPKSVNSKLPYTYQFRFLDKAAIMTPQDQLNPNGSAADPWSLCSMQQVEEVKCLLRVLPIWVSSILYFVVIVQQHTVVVFQALISDRRIGSSNFMIPAASYYVFLMITVAIWLPLYDRKVMPLLQKLTRRESGITLLQRMGTGIFFSIISMLVSAKVERHRRNLALTEPLGIETRKGVISSMSGSLYYCGHAGSSYLSTLLISTVHQITARSATGNWLPEDLNKGRLDNFYCIIAAIEVVNLGYFLICSQWYRYKGTDSSSTELEKLTQQSERTANGV
ncbi:hypothetical protein HN51_003313 [Arachis hypogaea]|nr:Protein NRT1/ PTR FAMILY 2 [Arachis hypogaea]